MLLIIFAAVAWKPWQELQQAGGGGVGGGAGNSYELDADWRLTFLIDPSVFFYYQCPALLVTIYKMTCSTVTDCQQYRARLWRK
jgi:hypothetical protein